MIRKNRVKLAAVAIMGTMLLAGCSDAIPELSDEQQKEIGEFAAITLLKYDANNRSRLVERRFIKGLDDPFEEPAEENQEDPGTQKPEEQSTQRDTNNPTIIESGDKNEPQYSDIARFLGLPAGVTITFTGLEFTDSYMPDGLDNSFFALDAAEGKKLAVLNFVLVNNSGETQEINILSMRPVFRVIFDNAGTKNTLATLLDTDLSTYKNTLGAGTSENVVLLAEIESGAESGIGSVNLLVRYGEDNYTFSLIP